MGMIILKFRYIFLLIIIFAVSACDNKNLKKDSIIRIGVSVDTYEDKFHLDIIKGIKEAAELSEHEIELTFTDAENDIRNQIMHVKGYIDQKMDAVIVIPVNSEEASPVSNMCLDAKMNLVYLNIKPEKLPEGIYYIGPEEYEEGRIQMEYAAEKLNGSGEIGILMGDLNQHAAIKRTEGIEKVLVKYPGIKVVKKQTAQFNRDMAKQIVKMWIESGVDLDAILSNNDEMAIGAIRALEEKEILENVYVFGVDGTKDGIQELKSGNLEATVFQDGVSQGKKSVEIVLNLLKNKKPEIETFVRPELITIENYDKIHFE